MGRTSVGDTAAGRNCPSIPRQHGSAIYTQQRRLAWRQPSLWLATMGARYAFARVHVARTFARRCAGLLGRKSLGEHDGLLLAPGRSVHTLGSRFAIDVVFLDVELNVLDVIAQLRPWRFAFAPRRTAYVLLLQAGRAGVAGLAKGQALTLRSAHSIFDRPSPPSDALRKTRLATTLSS